MPSECTLVGAPSAGGAWDIIRIQTDGRQVWGDWWISKIEYFCRASQSRAEISLGLRRRGWFLRPLKSVSELAVADREFSGYHVKFLFYRRLGVSIKKTQRRWYQTFGNLKWDLPVALQMVYLEQNIKKKKITAGPKYQQCMARGKLLAEQVVWFYHYSKHSRPQNPRSFWSAPKIETSIPDTDQKDRGLWGRECIQNKNCSWVFTCFMII